MAQNASIDSLDDIENKSDVLNQTSYSLHDASTGQNDLFELNDVELLDKSVTDLLDDPYRMKLRRNSNYDGFDQSLGDSWIYPVNYPLRRYQFTITEAALFKNTLVVLPTGLGKTFIAAVVMYNIYRWYPTGKVIFMAPTRPLVSQQIEACYRIMGIPRSDTAEVTGKQQRQKRTALWLKKRVFYATPQVVLADLESPEQTFPVQQVRLVVIDEAHKAKGRYAYTDVIRLIAERNPFFRVLALSATPGRTLEDVSEVIKNLLISHVEVRWDNSIDVLPYVFRKDVRTIVIPLGQTIVRLRKELLQLVNPYLQRLLESNVFMRYPGMVTPGMLIMEQKRFRKNALQQRHPNHSAISADF
uniref:Helicase ATP-binding domain-containing protein n=1 Tax=Anopheles maculatus TaxID=74869 RepID=A0A182SDU8_9DIPT